MNLSPLPLQKFFSNDGTPLAGGLLFTYAAGTATKIATWQETTGSVLNTNPIVLDFRGECRVWLDPTLSYKFVLAPPTDTDPPGNPIWTVDNIAGSSASSDNAAIDTGSPNTVRLSIPALASTPAMFNRIVWKSAFQNTGATTIVLNGGLSKNLLWQNRESIGPGALQVNGMYEAIYDGTAWQLQGPTLSPLEMLTVDEFVAGVIPTYYANLPGDINRYGASPAASATVNATAINNAMLASKFVFCTTPGVYTIDSAIEVQSDQTIWLTQGVTFRASVKAWNGPLIHINSKSNVRWYGGVIDGNKANNPAGTVFNIRVMNSSRVAFFGVASNNAPSDNVTLGAAGDGFYVGGFVTGSNEISLVGCSADANVRQGVSLVRGSKITITGCIFTNTTGNAPGAGIDCEANDVAHTLDDITISGCVISGCYHGIITTTASKNVSITGNTISNCRFAHLYFADCNRVTATGNTIVSGITVSSPIVECISAERVVFANNYVYGSGISPEGAGFRVLQGDKISIIGNTFENTFLQGIIVGSSAITVAPSIVVAKDNTFVNCVAPTATANTPVMGVSGNSGSAIYPLFVRYIDNTIIDTRTGGNEADLGVGVSTSIPASVQQNYRMENYVTGVAAVYTAGAVPPMCGIVTWDPPNIASGAGATSPDISVLGSNVSMAVEVYPPYTLASTQATGYVRTVDTAVIRLDNLSGVNFDGASSTNWRVRVRQLTSG